MAAGSIPALGTEYGACEDPCGHTTCNSTRAMMETPCRICSEPIDTRRFFNDTPDGEPAWSVLVHEDCLYHELDAKETA